LNQKKGDQGRKNGERGQFFPVFSADYLSTCSKKTLFLIPYPLQIQGKKISFI
jgi:hypothetical protein